jgi:hypothetical protein
MTLPFKVLARKKDLFEQVLLSQVTWRNLKFISTLIIKHFIKK